MNYTKGKRVVDNAHLIAAAPDMYVILADIAEALDKGTERLEVGREMILRQALAKAEGGIQ